MLAWLDQAGGTYAASVCCTPYMITLKMDEVVFKKPVKVNDHIRIYGEVAGPGASPEDAALLARVYRALDELPAKERLAWSLRVLHGERLDDVAALFGCSTRTAKRRVAAARKAIGEVMGDE